MNLTEASSPVWSRELPFMRAAWDVVVDPAASGALYVVGQGETSGWVARCTKAGACPD
jgi:hypothetical protein